MSFILLYIDEMRGYYKSRTMLILWLGLPVISIMLKIFAEDYQEVPFSILTALVISAVSAALGSVTIAASSSDEISKRVYDLFLVRPVRRHNLVLAKYFGVYSLLVAAVVIAMSLSIAVDAFIIHSSLDLIIADLKDTLTLSLTAIAFACAVGLLIGLNIDSVAVSAALAVYVGAQASSVLMFPAIFYEGDVSIITISSAVGVLITICILIACMILFNRRKL